jgi:hypothetical protein
MSLRPFVGGIYPNITSKRYEDDNLKSNCHFKEELEKTTKVKFKEQEG